MSSRWIILFVLVSVVASSKRSLNSLNDRGMKYIYNYIFISFIFEFWWGGYKNIQNFPIDAVCVYIFVCTRMRAFWYFFLSMDEMWNSYLCVCVYVYSCDMSIRKRIGGTGFIFLVCFACGFFFLSIWINKCKQSEEKAKIVNDI